MKRNYYMPLWADIVYKTLEFVDHKIVERLSSWLMWRFAFMDRHCRCEKCIERMIDRFTKECEAMSGIYDAQLGKKQDEPPPTRP
jgi:hypothetical protein